eukprot:5949801-Amphidinium_carterae.1
MAALRVIEPTVDTHASSAQISHKASSASRHSTFGRRAHTSARTTMWCLPRNTFFNVPRTGVFAHSAILRLLKDQEIASQRKNIKALCIFVKTNVLDINMPGRGQRNRATKCCQFFMLSCALSTE